MDLYVQRRQSPLCSVWARERTESGLSAVPAEALAAHLHSIDLRSSTYRQSSGVGLLFCPWKIKSKIQWWLLEGRILIVTEL